MTVSKTSEEVGHRIPVKNSKCKGYARQGVIKPEHESRIVPVSRITGGKDRHSKVRTSRGLRDRRVRLSVNTAIQFYDLQDRLGFQQPSMAVDWLINAAEDAIKDLPELPSEIGSGSQITTITTLSGESADKQPNNSSTRSEPQDEQSKIQGHDSPDKAKGTRSNSSASEGSIKASGPARSTLTSKAKAFSRDKARQKARERERAKKKTSSTDSPLPQPQQIFNEILPLQHPFSVPFKNILPCSCLRPNNAHEDGAGVAAVNHSLQLWEHMLPAYQALICNQDASKVAQSITSSMGAGTTAASSYEGYGIMDFAVETQDANQSELGCDNDSERVHRHIQSPGLFKVSAPRLGTRGPLQSNSDSISMPASSSDLTHKGPCQDFNTEGGSLGVFFHRNRACHQSNRML